MQDVSKVAFAGSESRAAPTHVVPLLPSLGEPHRFIDVGHSRLAYWKTGTGPDVVFVHGWPLHSATFRGIVPLLAPHFTCHLIDLPGSGHTVCTAESPFDFKAHAATVHRALHELGLARYALVAHDSGGFVARLVASRDRRVTALVLGNTEVPGHVPWLIRSYAAAARLPFGASAVRLAMRSRLIRESSLAFGGCFSDRAFLRGEFHSLHDRLPREASPEACLSARHGELNTFSSPHPRVELYASARPSGTTLRSSTRRIGRGRNVRLRSTLRPGTVYPCE